jgi:hypothetical protein
MIEIASEQINFYVRSVDSRFQNSLLRSCKFGRTPWTGLLQSLFLDRVTQAHKKPQANIDVVIEVQKHGSSFGAVEESKNLRTCGNFDRLLIHEDVL